MGVCLRSAGVKAPDQAKRLGSEISHTSGEGNIQRSTPFLHQLVK